MIISRLESHKRVRISDPNNRSNNFRKLSDILPNKIGDSNKNAHIDILKRYPEIAKCNVCHLTYSMLNEIECYMYLYEMIITCIT
jgi:hypothetical protein